jgi:hypothetical protein
MKRLGQRLDQLERRLGPCPGCREKTVELVQAGTPRRDRPEERYRICEQPLERITVLLHFDPDLETPR